MKLVLLLLCALYCPHWAIAEEDLATTDFPASETSEWLVEGSSRRPINVDSRARILIGLDDETPFLPGSSGSNVLRASSAAGPGDDWTPIVWPTTRLPERRVTQISPASTQPVRPTTAVPRRPLPIVVAAPARASIVGQLSTFIAPTSVRTVSILTQTPPTMVQFDLEDAGVLPVTTSNSSQPPPSTTLSSSSSIFFPENDSVGAGIASVLPTHLLNQSSDAEQSAVESPSESVSSERPSETMSMAEEIDETTELNDDSPASETSIIASIDDSEIVAPESDRRMNDSPSAEDIAMEDTTVEGEAVLEEDALTESLPEETSKNPEVVLFGSSSETAITPPFVAQAETPTTTTLPAVSEILPASSIPPTTLSVLPTAASDPPAVDSHSPTVTKASAEPAPAAVTDETSSTAAAVTVPNIAVHNSSLADYQTIRDPSTTSPQPVDPVTSSKREEIATEETGRGTLLSTLISVITSTLSSTTPPTVATSTTPTSTLSTASTTTTAAMTSTAPTTVGTTSAAPTSAAPTSAAPTSAAPTSAASTSAGTTPTAPTGTGTATATTTTATTVSISTTSTTTTITTKTTATTTAAPTTIRTPAQNFSDAPETSSDWAFTEGSQSTTAMPDSDATVIAVTVSIAAVLCLALLILLLFVIRRRRARAVQGTCQPARMDAYSMDNVSPSNTWQRGKLRSTLRASKRSYVNQAFEDPNAFSMQLTAAQLALYMEKPISNIEGEFSRIPNSSTVRIEELPVGVESKNRYANVLPIPETRVKIGLTEEQQQSHSADDDLKHYINANYIRGPKEEPHFYIACQGPLESTVADFWQMIWENQSKIIIQLTDLSENGVFRCAEYLPPSEVLDCHRLYGDYQVTLKSRELRDSYVTSYIQLKRMEDNLVRDITHLWYSSWPVTGVPNQVRTIVTLLLEARKGQSKEQPGPIVVHCSPGTGRTGTALAIDICLRQLDSTRSIDIPRCVYKLRQDRSGSVQTKEQYAFIYKAVNYYASQLSNAALDSL